MHLRFQRIITYFIFGFWSTTIFPAASLAALISMETSIGFNGFIRLNKWTPVTVVVENRGKSVDGILEIGVTSGSEYQGDVFETSYAMELALPYGSRKRCAFTVLFPSVTHDVKLRFSADGKILVADTVNLKNNVIDRDFALVLDSGISPDFLSSLPEQVFAARIDAKRLPDTWYGYEGVRMLILNPAMLKRLHPGQYRALEQWLKGGGYLVTSAGINYGSLGEDRMQRLLPLEIKGHFRLWDKAALEKFSGRKFNGTEPILVLNSRIRRSKTLAAAKGVPLIVQKRIERGTLLFLSFDVQSSGFNRWTGRRAFWEKVLAKKPAPEKTRSLLSDRQIADALLSNIRLRFPGFGSTALFLAVYVTAFGILMKAAGKRRNRRKPYALCILLCIICFSLMGGWFFFRKSPLSRINFKSFYLLSGNGRHLKGSGKYVFGVYSIQRAQCRIGFKASPYPVRHVLVKGSRAKTPNPYRLMNSARGRQIITHLPKWSHNFFRADTREDLPVSAGLVIKNKKLYLTVENSSRWTIRNGLIYYKRRFFSMGNIAAKETKKITLEPDLSLIKNQIEEPDFEQRFISQGLEKDPSSFQAVQQYLAKDLLTGLYSKYHPDQDTALFIGWIRNSIIKPDFHGPAVHGNGITLIDWEIPIERPAAPQAGSRLRSGKRPGILAQGE